MLFDILGAQKYSGQELPKTPHDTKANKIFPEVFKQILLHLVTSLPRFATSIQALPVRRFNLLALCECFLCLCVIFAVRQEHFFIEKFRL